MRKRRFYITKEEGQAIEAACEYVLTKERTNENTPLEKVECLIKIRNIWNKLRNYQWEIDNN